MAASSSNWRTSTPKDTLAPGHGAKRRLTRDGDDAETTQRLAKRFHLLNIGTASLDSLLRVQTQSVAENNGRLWVDPATNSIPATQSPASSVRVPSTANEHMQVEDTKHRVYIHNLDEELAEISDEDKQEDRLIFIPDIERKLNKLPMRPIFGGQQERTGSEMVLYSVPKALSVPEEQDSVRRAIIEARARKRQEQCQPSRDALLHEDASDPTDSQDDDAMDLS